MASIRKLTCLLILLSTVACTKSRIIQEDLSPSSKDIQTTTEILSFSSRESLDKAIENHSVFDSFGNSLVDNLTQSKTTFQLRSNVEDEIEISHLSELVPDPALAALQILMEKLSSMTRFTSLHH